jgi:hypothetical protein
MANLHVIDEHFGEAGAAGSGGGSGSSTGSSGSSTSSGRTPPATPTRAMNIRGTTRRAKPCTAAEQEQCRALQQQLDHGSLADNISIVSTQGCLKQQRPPGHGALADPPVAHADANACSPCGGVVVAIRDKRRRCRNCRVSYFARAASEHGVATALGVASFCSNDCLWSFSIRAEDGC